MPASSGAWMPPAQTTVRVRISVPSLSFTRSGAISLTPVPSRRLHAAVLQLVGGVGVGLVGERREHDRAVVDEVDARSG